MKKVTKKLETIARACAYSAFVKNGMLTVKGAEYVHDLVDERWFQFMDEAIHFNNMLKIANGCDLVGEYDESLVFQQE